MVRISQWKWVASGALAVAIAAVGALGAGSSIEASPQSLTVTVHPEQQLATVPSTAIGVNASTTTGTSCRINSQSY